MAVLSDVTASRSDAGGGVGLGVPGGDLLGDDVDADAADLGGGPAEVLLDEARFETDGWRAHSASSLGTT